MKNLMESSEQINPLSYLDREEDWENKIKETVAAYDWSTTDLLHDEDEVKKIDAELAFKDIPPAEQAIYAETAGRLALGLMNYVPEIENKSRLEMIALRDKISGQNADLAPFLHMLSWRFAREADSNTYGNADRVFTEIISGAAVNATKAGQRELHDALMNPFHLADGTEIFKFDKKSGKIESFSIEVLIENGDGIVVFGPGENDYEDIITFNRRLSFGDYMKKDGDNSLGGLKYLQDSLGFDRLLPGMIIKTDISTPMDKEIKIENIEVVKTNQAELEEKYGQAYFSFLEKSPRNNKILTGSFKSSSGQQFDNFNFMDLKIVK